MNREDILPILAICVVLFLLEIAYFSLARYFKIIDRPNKRSSHQEPTIRGGGIIFVFAWFLYFFIAESPFQYVSIGLLLVSLVSFIDDIHDVGSLTRLLFHMMAFSFCFYELNLFNLLPIWGIVCLYIVSIGCINAINFMDGINGITALNALSIILPLRLMQTHYMLDGPLFYIIIALVVFLFFNYRKKAKCFAGDIGSVSLGYIIIFIILGLLFGLYEPHEGLVGLTKDKIAFHPKYILLLLFFGVDSILTIVHRIILGENIFKAHRWHLFQLLTNEVGWSHLAVSALYGILQFIATYYVLYNKVSAAATILIILFFSIIYILAKIIIMKKYMKQDKVVEATL
ncbi:MAG: UDP-GlcNAc--UDP-phosphate GlcNAc-1-phosphate transferase [Chitinophagaceae bacterium]